MNIADLKVDIKTAIAVVMAAFALFFFLDDRHTHYTEFDDNRASMYDEIDYVDSDLRERILMAESTRYAEVAKFYTDKLKAGEPLTDAEKARLDLVERQQERIRRMLAGDP